MGCWRDTAKICPGVKLISHVDHPHGQQLYCEGTLGISERVLKNSGSKHEIRQLPVEA